MISIGWTRLMQWSNPRHISSGNVYRQKSYLMLCSTSLVLYSTSWHSFLCVNVCDFPIHYWPDLRYTWSLTYNSLVCMPKEISIHVLFFSSPILVSRFPPMVGFSLLNGMKNNHGSAVRVFMCLLIFLSFTTGRIATDDSYLSLWEQLELDLSMWREGLLAYSLKGTK